MGKNQQKGKFWQYEKKKQISKQTLMQWKGMGGTLQIVCNWFLTRYTQNLGESNLENLVEAWQNNFVSAKYHNRLKKLGLAFCTPLCFFLTVIHIYFILQKFQCTTEQKLKKKNSNPSSSSQIVWKVLENKRSLQRKVPNATGRREVTGLIYTS